MDIIIDTSAIIAVIAAEPERERLIELTIGSNLLAPGSIHWETGNAFSAMFKRERISLEQSLAAIKSYLDIPIRLVSIDIEEALKLAERLDIYAYDAYVLLCADRFRAPILTLDRRLQARARSIELAVLEV